MGKMLSKNWLIYKIHDELLSQNIKKYTQGRLLDIGCGDKQYKEMINPFVTEHIGLDHEETLHDKANIDLFGTAYNVPIDDNYFDTDLCTAVLEHLEEPDKAIKEAYRVLKSGGYAIYTVPLFWLLHEEPRDFYRYTKYGLKYLFEKNGFRIVEINALSGFWVTFGQELVYYLWRLRYGGKLNPLWWLVPLAGVPIQVICYLLNKIDHSEELLGCIWWWQKMKSFNN
jgi:SAM-dependent methyltransferase